jgi:hypothetical protein
LSFTLQGFFFPGGEDDAKRSTETEERPARGEEEEEHDHEGVDEHMDDDIPRLEDD